MDFDAEMESKIHANNWKLVGRKRNCNHTKRRHKKPLPASLEDWNQSPRAPNTTHITIATTKRDQSHALIKTERKSKSILKLKTTK